MSVLQLGDDLLSLSFSRIWQLSSEEHVDILGLSVMLLCLPALSSVLVLREGSAVHITQ